MLNFLQSSLISFTLLYTLTHDSRNFGFLPINKYISNLFTTDIIHYITSNWTDVTLVLASDHLWSNSLYQIPLNDFYRLIPPLCFRGWRPFTRKFIHYRDEYTFTSDCHFFAQFSWPASGQETLTNISPDNECLVFTYRFLLPSFAATVYSRPVLELPIKKATLKRLASFWLAIS